MTGAPALRSYELALTDPDFKFPQVWRTNIAVDQRLPWGMIGTAEFIYNNDVNGIYYINANLPAAQAAFTGADDPSRAGRQTTASTTRRQPGHQRHRAEEPERRLVVELRATLSNEAAQPRGFAARAPTATAIAKNTVDPGSTAFGSWTATPHAGDPNNPGMRLLGVRARRSPLLRAGLVPEGTSSSARRRSRRSGSRGTIGNTSYVFARRPERRRRLEATT